MVRQMITEWLPACHVANLTTCREHERTNEILEEPWTPSMRTASKRQRLMAPSFAASAKLSPLSSSYISRAKNRRLPSIRCSSGSPDSGDGAPPVIRAVVGAVTELLRALSPKKPRDDAQKGAGGAELELPRSVDDVVAVLEADYQRAYFLTGNFTPDIYAEDCLFGDPTIKFCGRSRYSENLDLLVPFFHSPSLELESIEKGLRVETKFIIVTWTLRTYLRLPWRPLISIRGNTTYDLDGEYKITRHAESWDVSALEAISQIFVSAPK